MSTPEPNPFPGTETDAQLQAELRSLFVVDTQNYLQRYGQIVQQLQAASWKGDIQELYRCVHTIKGGAVTVAAEAILHVATALEDLLADLRYLDLAPPLADGHLSQALLEAGELLTGSLELQTTPSTQPILQRLQMLHQEMRERYLSQWNEQRQLHQEFAEQGFDLVVLELEIALERLPHHGTVSVALVNTAQQILAQLQQIGNELQFAAGWASLLNQAETILARSENAIWKSHWLQLFSALKLCAKRSGSPVVFEFVEMEFADLEPAGQSDGGEGEEGGEREATGSVFSEIPAIDRSSSPHQPDWTSDWTNAADEQVDLTDVGSFLDELQPLADFGAALEEMPDLAEITDWLDASDQTNADSRVDSPEYPGIQDLNVQDWSDAADRTSSFADLSQVPAFGEQQIPADAAVSLTAVDLTAVDLTAVDLTAVEPPFVPDASPAAADSAPSERERPDNTMEKVQIPVPLEKLDRSSQHLVETLLGLRTTQGFYQTLQNQIGQIVALARESVQYVTHLRQIQDDYALLNDLRGDLQAAAQGPTPERYRQGYTVINRLLETSLRLSEMGAETGKTAQHITENLRNVDTSVLKLQTTVQESRLVPFQNLTFRARAILRDLVTRYGKPARLLVQGERTELDINTARNLEPALLHLIRNAYDHGLEAADDRTAQGKPAQGTITLSLKRRGNTFQLEFADDGCGINAEMIRARAESLDLPLTQTQTPAELLAVICQPGFTSEMQVSEISGRGVGMDVVAAQATRLAGRLSLQTVPGAGTTFRLQFPVPRLLVPCILLQAGDHTFAIPIDDIRTTTLLDTLNARPLKESQQRYSWVIENETGSTAALDLLAYWQPQMAGRPLADTAVCVYIHPPEWQQGIWLLADELLERSDLIITPVPVPLSAPDGLIGVSLQTNGVLVPVLDARALAERLLTNAIEPSPPATAPELETHSWETDRSSQTILIVDDAALMRRRLEASLNAYGYITQTCADGREAWNWLQQHPHPRLVITDIEMPNMDGFTLVDRCRQTGITVPILVISSRLSEEWFDEARRLGASDYLTKGFSTNELLDKVNALLNVQD